MAVKELIRARMSLIYNLGEDNEGEIITQRIGYDTKTDAEVDSLNAVALAMASLSEYPLIELSLAETSSIA